MKDRAATERLYNLALSNLAAGRLPDARAIAEQVLKLDKYHPAATHLLAVIEFHSGHPFKAVELAERAIRFCATDRSFHHTRAVALRTLGRFADAESAARQAVNLAPRDPEEISELGLILASLGRNEEAVECYERALAIAPNHPAPRMNYSALLLMRGDFERGWAYHESRPSLAQLRRSLPPATAFWWSGTEDLNGKRLLVHAEQGIGDTILFARYLPLLADRHPEARITLACHPRLVELLKHVTARIEVIPQTQSPQGSYPPADFHAGLLSLPRIFQTTIDTIPGRCPYLRADAAAIERWRERVNSPAAPANLKVGLAWAGNPKYALDRARSIDLKELIPLLRVPGATWFTLQMGEPTRQIEQLPDDLRARIIDLTPQQTDLAETAAMLANLDLIVSVDTAVANLAGALGGETWVLLSDAADWRWNGPTPQSSGWFPTAKLFRQQARGDWNAAIESIAENLKKKTSGTT